MLSTYKRLLILIENDRLSINIKIRFARKNGKYIIVFKYRFVGHFD